MSLSTDIIFMKALRSNAHLMGRLPAGNVYDTAIQLPDRDAANAPAPYIIVSYDGMTNDDTNKDNDYEGDTDRVKIGIEVAARTSDELSEIMEEVRATIRDYFIEHNNEDDDDYELIPMSTVPSAGRKMYDPDKPCLWQVLTYQCETTP